MKLSALYLALCMGVAVVVAKPQGEASPVTKEVADSPADPAPVEAPAAEEEGDGEESPRPKRWYFPGGYFPGGYADGFGYGFPNGYDHHFNRFNHMAGTGNSFGTPIHGRTGSHYGHPNWRTTASFNQLENHQRHQNRLWQYQNWQMHQNFGGNFGNNYPDVVDTGRPFNNFNNGRRPFNQGFNNFNQHEVVDTQTPEGRTRVQNAMMNSGSGHNPVFAQRPNWQGGWNPNFNPFHGYY